MSNKPNEGAVNAFMQQLRFRMNQIEAQLQTEESGNKMFLPSSLNVTPDLFISGHFTFIFRAFISAIVLLNSVVEALDKIEA